MWNKTLEFVGYSSRLLNAALETLNKVTGQKANELWIDVGSPERLGLAINAHKEEN